MERSKRLCHFASCELFLGFLSIEEDRHSLICFIDSISLLPLSVSVKKSKAPGSFSVLFGFSGSVEVSM